ncbi:hypothetical protein ACHAXS_011473 [Conticribra weissflogii]
MYPLTSSTENQLSEEIAGHMKSHEMLLKSLCATNGLQSETRLILSIGFIKQVPTSKVQRKYEVMATAWLRQL